MQPSDHPMFRVRFQREASPNVISVIIPVYKDIKGLQDTVSSIQKCTIPAGTSLELIVVNDGSDPSISDYCRQLELIEVSISPNKGSYHARNRGIEFSSGESIGFVDADIFVDSQWIENGYRSLTQAPYVAGRIRVIREGATKTVAEYQELIDFNTEWHMKSIHYGPTANIWVHRQLIGKIGGFNENIFSGGDMEYGKRVFANAPSNQIYAPDVIVNHPPRTFRGLLAKSRRLANGHNVIGDAVNLDQEFTLLASISRNLGRNAADRKLPLGVQALRVFLFAHRLLFKFLYKISKKPKAFSIEIDTKPTVNYRNYKA